MGLVSDGGEREGGFSEVSGRLGDNMTRITINFVVNWPSCTPSSFVSIASALMLFSKLLHSFVYHTVAQLPIDPPRY